MLVSDRAKVTKGLPDAVTIMEGKVQQPLLIQTHEISNLLSETGINPLMIASFFDSFSPQSLCLTCFICGTPDPEVVWLRNDKEIVNQDQFVITKEPNCSTITINDVTVENSGKYSIFVRNKYGCETVDVTVSVYKTGEKPPANAVEMGY